MIPAGMQMVTVMIKTTMKHASSMVETAVDPMSIQITAQYVNALNEEQIEENTIFDFFC